MKSILLGVLLLASTLSADLVDDGFKEHNNGNYTKAAELFGKTCDGGYAEACSCLGLMYVTGDGVSADKSIAKDFFEKAFTAGGNGGCKGYRILNEAGIR